MIQEQEEVVTGVVCLRCGTRTPIAVSNDPRLSTGSDRILLFPLTIVRCGECGKESSYLRGEIIAFKAVPRHFCSAA